jgi:hypothetical protein
MESAELRVCKPRLGQGIMEWWNDGNRNERHTLELNKKPMISISYRTFERYIYQRLRWEGKFLTVF